MAYALVGTIGTVVQSASGGAASPTFGALETRTARNLLVCWALGQGTATLPSTPAGWTLASQVAGTSCSVSVYYKVATGADAAPVLALVASTVLTAQLAEFSGNSPNLAALDKTGTNAGVTSALVAPTVGSPDEASGELVIAACGAFYSVGATSANSVAFNNGAAAIQSDNSASSTANHYTFGYGITTSQALTDTCAFTFTTQNVTGAVIAMGTFGLPPVSTTGQGTNQALKRASYL